MTYVPCQLYRIARQPENQFARLVGTVGYIVQIEGDYCDFQGIHEDGRNSGFGTLPLSCLEPEDRPEWLEAFRMHGAVTDIPRAVLPSKVPIDWARRSAALRRRRDATADRASPGTDNHS